MDARLIHLTYSSANRVPYAEFKTDKQIGKTPFKVSFNADATKDFDGDELVYEWDFGDGEKSAEKNPIHTFGKPGEYRTTLTVRDPSGETAKSETIIKAGNDLPEVNIVIKGNSSFYWGNETLGYEVTVKDSEDGSISSGINPSAVTFTADYLAEGKDVTETIQGHQANMEASANLVGKTLFEASDCKACHHAIEKSVGPSLTQID
jgi:cytochrome c